MKKNISILIAVVLIFNLCFVSVYAAGFDMTFIRNITENLPVGTEIMLKLSGKPVGTAEVWLYDDEGNQLEQANASDQIWREITEEEQVLYAKAKDAAGNVIGTTAALVMPAGVTYAGGQVFYDFNFDGDGSTVVNDTTKTSSTGMYHSTLTNSDYSAVFYRVNSSDSVTIENNGATAFAGNTQGGYLKLSLGSDTGHKIQASQLTTNVSEGAVVVEMDVISKSDSGHDTFMLPVALTDGNTSISSFKSLTGNKSQISFRLASNDLKTVTSLADNWNHVVYIIDLDRDVVSAVVNRTHLYSYTYPSGIGKIQRLTLNAANGDMYIDNLKISALPSITVSRQTADSKLALPLGVEENINLSVPEGLDSATLKLYDVTGGSDMLLGTGKTVSVPTVTYDRKVRAAAFNANGTKIACLSNEITIPGAITNTNKNTIYDLNFEQNSFTGDNYWAKKLADSDGNVILPNVPGNTDYYFGGSIGDNNNSVEITEPGSAITNAQTGNRAMHLHQDSTKAIDLSQLQIGPHSEGIVVFEMDWNAQDNLTETVDVLKPTKASGNLAALQYENGTEGSNSIGTFSFNGNEVKIDNPREWQKIRCIVDLDNDEMGYSVNGKFMGSVANDADVEITRFYIAVPKTDLASQADVWIDNVNVFSSDNTDVDGMTVHYLAGEKEISAVQQGTITLKAVLTSNGVAKTQILIGTVYSGNRLVSVQMLDVNFSEDETEKTVEMTLQNVAADMTIKTMLWDTTANMNPIVSAVELEPEA